MLAAEFEQQAVLGVPDARAGRAPERHARIARRTASGRSQRGPAGRPVRSALDGPIACRQQRQAASAAPRPRRRPRWCTSAGAGSVTERRSPRHPSAPSALISAVQRRLHHARRQHLLPHAPQDVVQHLAAAQRRGDPACVLVVLGPVDADAARADDARPRRRAAGRPRTASMPRAAVGALQPGRGGGAPASVTRNGLKPLASDAAGQQQFRRLADQRVGRPAERRVGRDEDEAAPARRSRSAMSAAIVTRSRQRWRLSSRACRNVSPGLVRQSVERRRCLVHDPDPP